MLQETPLPTGKITLVFTDIADSSRMTSDLGNTDYLEHLRNPHQRMMLAAFTQYNGVPILTAGDSFMAVFQYAKDALACVSAIQNQLAREPLTTPRKTQPEKGLWTLRVRIGVHTAEQEVVPNRLTWIPNAKMAPGHIEYSGGDTNFAARIGDLGVGGQIIVSASTYRAADASSQYRWQDWPNRYLKSFEAAPETVWELLYDGQGRGEPGMRWLPDWFRGELNRYVARPELQGQVINYFKKGRDNVRKRLVTLHAEGGMGKSRLAVAAALEMVGLFQDGVYFVNLARDESDASFRTREALAQTISAAVGLSGQELQPETLLTFLRSKETLLILDNYESVDGQQARLFLRDLINQTTSLCLLVTGRTPVGLTDAEQVVPMSEGMTDAQARSLFLAYAALQKPQWTPDDEDEQEVTRILALTERIPLAVELAAAWVGSRSIKEIADGLKATPLGRYSGTGKGIDRADPSPHHYSLTRSLDWSYNLLDAEAREALAAVSLFADSFEEKAVAAVTGKEADQVEDMLDYLSRVSLLRRTEENKASRYSLHRFTQRYAAGKLAILPAVDDLQEGFVNYYVQLAAANDNINAAPHRAVLTLEWQNALAAVSFAEARQDWSSVLSLSGLGKFLNLRGLWLEQERLYDAALEGARAAKNRQGEGQTLRDLGNVHTSRGEWDKAEQAYGQSLSIFRELEDRQGEGDALCSLGLVYCDRCEWEVAEQSYGQSLPIFRELGDRQGEGRALNNLGLVYCNRGEWDKAEQAYRQDLQICRDLGDRQGEGMTLVNLGNVYWNRGERDKAEQSYGQSLSIFRELGDRRNEGKALGNLGNVYTSREEWDRAEQSYSQSVSIFRELGDSQGEGMTLSDLGEMYEGQGAWDKADQSYDQSVSIFRELGDCQGEGLTLGNRARLMRAQGKQAEAIAYAKEAVMVLEGAEDGERLTQARELLAELEG